MYALPRPPPDLTAVGALASGVLDSLPLLGKRAMCRDHTTRSAGLTIEAAERTTAW